jgi:HEAT repeat protein
VEGRRAALAGIGGTKERSFLSILLDASQAEDTATRLVAVSSLAAYGDPQAVERVGEVARNDLDLSVKTAAIELLGESSSPPATVALIELLASSAVRPRAVHALSRHAKSRVSHVVAALADASGEVAEALVTVLLALPQGSAEPVLIETLKLSNDPARRAAVRALRFAFDTELSRQALARAASQDADPEVRRVAAVPSS